MIIFPVEIHFLLCPEIPYQPQPLLGLGYSDARFVLFAICFELAPLPPSAHSQECSTIRNYVHSRNHLCQQSRRPKGNRSYHCSHMDQARLGCQMRQRKPTVQSASIGPSSSHVVVRHRDPPEPKLFSLDCSPIGQLPLLMPIGKSQDELQTVNSQHRKPTTTPV